MMIYYEVLSNKEKELWQVLDALARNLGNISYQKMLTDLGLTSFTLESRLTKLNQMWQDKFKEPLLLEDQDEIYISDQQLLRMQNQILKESLGNTMLLDLFLDRYELLQFMQTHGISQATAYRVRREVKEALESYDIKLTQTQMIGDEGVIRNLYMSVLNFRLLDFDELTGAGTRHEIEKTVKKITDHYQLDLRHTEQELMNNVIFLTKTRYDGRHFMELVVPLDVSGTDEAFVVSLQDTMKVPVAYLHTELAQLEMFLYAFGLIKEVAFIPSEEVTKIRNLDEALIRAVNIVFHIHKMDYQRYAELRVLINQIHWRNHYYPNFFKSFGFLRNQTWEKQFVGIFELTDDLYQRYEILDPRYHLSKDDRARLYHDYFFLLVDYVSDWAAERPVYLCVDFSQSSVMYNFINPILTNIWFANIVVQTKIDEKTDFYLSDRYDPSLKLPQVTWCQPPLYRELMNLIDLASSISKEKQADI